MNRSKLIGGLVVLLAVFLTGFIPQYLGKRRLQSDLDDTRAQLSTAQLQNHIDKARNLAGRMLLEATRQNYGNAGELSTNVFNELSNLAGQAENPAVKSAVTELMQQRDAITSGLAQGNPSIIPDLQSFLQRLYDLPNPETAVK